MLNILTLYNNKKIIKTNQTTKTQQTINSLLM